MSDRKNGSKDQNKETTNQSVSKSHQEQVEHFRLDLDDQKVGENLAMESNELHSHSDKSAGPVAPEGFTPAGKKRPSPEPAKAPGKKAQEDPELQRLEKEHKKRSRKKGKKNRWFFRGVWFVVLIFIGIGIAQFALTCFNDMLAFQKEPNAVTVELKKNASTEEIADELLAKDVIRNKWAFCMYSKFTKSDGEYEYGTFELTTDMDYEAIINSLQASTSRVDTVTVTFHEGMNAMEMGDKLEEAGVCTAEEFKETVNNKELFSNYKFISDIQDEEGRLYFLEGYLFPDTYEFYKDEGAASAIEKMLNNTSDKLTGKLYKAAEKANMSMDEVLTLASMIQAEAADKPDMYNISSVFHNRLKSGVDGGYGYLNSDPTMWYPYRSAETVPEGYESAYNTYNTPGLPLGPICNPGMTAIEAALDPADTNYYYFCHDKDGKAYYAETEWEHENNKAMAGLTS
ncbi:MAG: endolytic transglycosylase MltG [Oscillospiraceae bacterium]|nr:endolytic transglycosylase MltG [Oscillospiraceae bacterium]